MATAKKKEGKQLVLKGRPSPVQEDFFTATAAHIGFGGARY